MRENAVFPKRTLTSEFPSFANLLLKFLDK